MSNRYNFYRLEHKTHLLSFDKGAGIVGLGPYQKIADYISCGLYDEQLSLVLEILESKQRSRLSYIGKDGRWDKTVIPPSSFMIKHPSPFEDPGLRDYSIRNIIFVDQPQIGYFIEPTIFGFSSMEDAQNWFELDSYECEAFGLAGFHYVNYITDNIVTGLKQSLTQVNCEMRVKNCFDF